MKVKICGITTREDALAAVDAGADALGFNFAPEARAKNRFIEPVDARRIVESLPPFVTSVGVCVNETTERMREYLEFVDWIQLHGEESAEQCRELGARCIKAFRIDGDFDPARIARYPVGAYLVDAPVPGARGGTGTAWDWGAAKGVALLDRPLILAGGLTPENVAEAIRAVKPYAVDTASGVESEPGKKDHEQIRRFIHNAKTSLP